ncbi:MAG: hypothetical protein EAZ32_04725 [Cytophagia bacterium]|nr:MAG: hypothetical protein EAZ32_04725 [Cytophagia bacterium]
MSKPLCFKEVDVGFYLGFLEASENDPNYNFFDPYTQYIPSQDNSCDELWCICDPNGSFHTIESGLFDAYIRLDKEPIEMKFLGSFKTFKLAEECLNQLFERGIKFETAPVVESEYYYPDYSDKKQSIFV